MANTNTPFGFIPYRQYSGGAWSGQVKEFLIPSTDSTAVFVGDIVSHAGGAGAAGTVVAGRNCEGMPTCAQSTVASLYKLGAVVGFVVGSGDTLIPNYRRASTNRIALVSTDPMTVYLVQEDSDGNSIDATEMGMNADLVVGTGNTATGRSGMMLDSTSAASTAGQSFKILGLARTADPTSTSGENQFGSYAKFEVIFNIGEHYLGNATSL